MRAVYAYRTRADGVTHEERFASFWKALDRVEYDVEQNSETVEPLTITVGQAVFDWPHLKVLLDVGKG